MPKPQAAAGPLPDLPAAEVLSFLRETRGVLTWTAADLAKSLRIGKRDAAQIVAILELQGYVKASGGREYLSTEDGNAVAGSSVPRFGREKVRQALSLLRKRMRAANEDPKGRYQVAQAVAFGDFLTGRPRVQPADVGVRLELRNRGKDGMVSASENAARKAFLTQLRQKSAMLRLQLYEEWMGARSHERLI